MTRAEQVVAGARAVVGARFRVQGRDPALGLDCVGVAACALRAAGCTAVVPNHYSVRCAVLPAGAVPPDLTGADGAGAGDILLCRVSPAQLHLAVRTDSGVVHADASLRRVVERPGAPPWPVIAAWRLQEGE